jgi:hypothetical protein
MLFVKNDDMGCKTIAPAMSKMLFPSPLQNAGATGRFRLFQVCADIGDPQTQARETAALWEAMDEMDIAEGVIVTLDEERKIEQAGKQIRFLPAYAWFLE